MRTPLVYIVDDEPYVCEALSLLFTAAKMKTQTFGTAEQFLVQVTNAKPVCLVSDINLPGMDGLALQKALIEKKIKIPIIFMTAYAKVPMAVEAVQLGAVDFIEKPYDPDILLGQVQRIFTAKKPKRNRSYAQLIRVLTTREIEVMNLMIEGNSNRQMGILLGISHRTIEVHRAKVIKKLGVNSLSDVVKIGLSASRKRQ